MITMDLLISKYNYWIAIVLFLIGLHAIIVKRNLVKKIIGLSIFQASIMLFYVSIGAKTSGGIPILSHEQAHGHGPIDVTLFANPLPHVLMLTAIVVGVGITGVALALVERLHEEFGSVEEDALIDALAKDTE